jgi:CheY-like chemotaxis protein
MYQRIIKRSGLVGDVLPFIYAEDALAYLKSPDSKPIDVIFLDINMPRMNGFEFLSAATEALGAGFARMVVVMLTTSLEKSDRVRANDYPVVRRFINKPLTVDHLSDVADLLQQLKAA